MNSLQATTQPDSEKKSVCAQSVCVSEGGGWWW